MIIDQSRRLRGISISRLSEYLSLCKIDVLVRNAVQTAPSRRVDQPSKVGQAGTMSKSVKPARPSFTLEIRNNLKLGNRNLTLLIKKGLLQQLRIKIDSLSEVGSVVLQQDNIDFDKLALYNAVCRADNFANKRKEWRVCLALNKQDQWVNSFLILSRNSRLPVDYFILVNQGQIQVFKI